MLPHVFASKECTLTLSDLGLYSQGGVRGARHRPYGTFQPVCFNFDCMRGGGCCQRLLVFLCVGSSDFQWEKGDVGGRGERVVSKNFSWYCFNHRFQTLDFMLLNVKIFRKNISILNTVDEIVDGFIIFFKAALFVFLKLKSRLHKCI